MNVGQRIQAARKTKGLTQKQLGERVGLATGTIQQYELGKREPKMEILQRIADALGVSLSYLLDQEEPDREYEELLDVLHTANITVTAAGFSYGGADRDVFYLRQEGAPEEERTEIEYKDLTQLVHRVLQDAENKKLSYIRQRLNIELF